LTITLLYQANELITLNTVLSLPVICGTSSLLLFHKDEDVAYRVSQIGKRANSHLGQPHTTPAFYKS